MISLAHIYVLLLLFSLPSADDPASQSDELQMAAEQLSALEKLKKSIRSVEENVRNQNLNLLTIFLLTNLKRKEHLQS